MQLKTTATVDLANADETTGDTVNVGGFANVDAGNGADCLFQRVGVVAHADVGDGFAEGFAGAVTVNDCWVPVAAAYCTEKPLRLWLNVSGLTISI